ncbi:MAG: ISL3 family transposase [Gammaproteobacteria bacterium]|jgi:transposase|nr:ISL3 family transposase [Gammaproteobacteria bacterium]
MVEAELFAAALGLQQPWYVSGLEFSVLNKRLDIEIDFEPGSLFPCPVCGTPSKAYDTTTKSWRHLNFFQHEAHLIARVPRVACPNGCGTKRVEVPWARSGSGFTLLFESLLLAFCREIPVAKVATMVSVHDTRLWRMLHHYIDKARRKVDFSKVSRVGMDETSSKRGHDYITLFCDMDERKLLFATEGKDMATVGAFKSDFEAHNGCAEKVTQVSCDMSPAFISGVAKEMPKADITFDKFHVIKLLNEGVDEVRRKEVKENEVLKGTRYLWLKNKVNLTQKQHGTFDGLSELNLKTSRAYHLKINFQEFYNCPDRESGEACLNRWYYWATHSRIAPMIKVAKTIKRHWDGVLSWFDSHLTNALLEGMNSLIQAAKSRARGYRSNRNFIAMAYLIGAKLEFELPT